MPYYGLNANITQEDFTKFKVNLVSKGVKITDILSTFISMIANDINLIDQFNGKGLKNESRNNPESNTSK